MRTLIFAITLLVAFASCESEEEKQQFEQMLIEQDVEKRIVEYKRILDENCEAKVLEEATRIADSIIIEQARMLKDTLLKPFKPDRPEAPELKTLEDTLKVKPFLPKPKRDTDTTGKE